jgi:hypothetical protein
MKCHLTAVSGATAILLFYLADQGVLAMAVSRVSMGAYPLVLTMSSNSERQLELGSR